MPRRSAPEAAQLRRRRRRETQNTNIDVRGATSTSAGAPGASWKSTTASGASTSAPGSRMMMRVLWAPARKDHARGLEHRSVGTGSATMRRSAEKSKGEGGLSSGRTPKSSAGIIDERTALGNGSASPGAPVEPDVDQERDAPLVGLLPTQMASGAAWR